MALPTGSTTSATYRYTSSGFMRWAASSGKRYSTPSVSVTTWCGTPPMSRSSSRQKSRDTNRPVSVFDGWNTWSGAPGSSKTLGGSGVCGSPSSTTNSRPWCICQPRPYDDGSAEYIFVPPSSWTTSLLE
jgi:hypothetical protein